MHGEEDEVAGSDLPPAVTAWLDAQPIETIHVVGRRGAAEARFTDHELAELGTLQRARPVVDEYLSTPAPKLLVATPSGAGAYWVANPNDIEGARKRLLTNCRERSGAECTVVMENNELVRPLVTGAITPKVTAR